MTEDRSSASTSPFSALFDEANAAAPETAPKRNPVPAGESTPAPRSKVSHADSQQRPQNEKPAEPVPQANATVDVASPSVATANQGTTVVAGPAAATEPVPSADDIDAAADETIDVEAMAAQSAVVPASPTPPAVTATPSLAGGPAAAPDVDDAAAETIGELAAVAPAVDAENRPDRAQAQQPGETTPATQATGHISTAHAQPKPGSATADANDLLQVAASGAATTEVTASDSQQADVQSASHQATHAETSSHLSQRSHAPDAAERASIARPGHEALQTAQPASDTVPLAHLQSGREAGATAAAPAPAAAADTSNATASAPVPLQGLAVEIAARAQNGGNRFEIRLDPPELGRIEVRLDIDRSGQVTSRLVVDKVETLDVLRRDAHQLERALQDAGLKTSDNGLQLSLRDQAFAERHDRGGSRSVHALIADPELPAADSVAVAYGTTLRSSGVDIRV